MSKERSGMAAFGEAIQIVCDLEQFSRDRREVEAAAEERRETQRWLAEAMPQVVTRGLEWRLRRGADGVTSELGGDRYVATYSARAGGMRREALVRLNEWDVDNRDAYGVTCYVHLAIDGYESDAVALADAIGRRPKEEPTPEQGRDFLALLWNRLRVIGGPLGMDEAAMPRSWREAAARALDLAKEIGEIVEEDYL